MQQCRACSNFYNESRYISLFLLQVDKESPMPKRSTRSRRSVNASSHLPEITEQTTGDSEEVSELVYLLANTFTNVLAYWLKVE